MNEDNRTTFSVLIHNKQLLDALDQAGYEAPTPIQQQMIPFMTQGHDVIGQAQTGTGKTAAFSLPLIEKLVLSGKKQPQALILTPTRELALQVADEIQKYAKLIPELNLAAIFGGQDYAIQLRQLKKKPQILVGTPGRTMDHIRKGTISLVNIKTLILDEADEMLNMGFIDDIEWILEKMPEKIQTALFSATMPRSIRDIASKYLRNPVEIKIKNRTATATTIDQGYLITHNQRGKTEALCRVIDGEQSDGVLVFVRTKLQTVELAEQLTTKGYLCSPLNGDMVQEHRNRAVDQLKKGIINILIATDVAARGLDVERVSHVINFDIPFDVESYIHRVGRTGRAGRTGKAVLFVHPREKRMLKTISRVTKSDIKEITVPTNQDIEKRRIEAFFKKVNELIEQPALDHSSYQELAYHLLNGADTVDLVAVLARLASGPAGLFLPPEKERQKSAEGKRSKGQREQPVRKKKKKDIEEGMERYQLEAGHNHNVKPANIVGAIANEADLDSGYIGQISIYDTHSHVDLPYGMPREVLRKLKRARINGVMMQLTRVQDKTNTPSDKRKAPKKQQKKKEK